MKIISHRFVGNHVEDKFPRLKSIEVCCENFFKEINNKNFVIDLARPAIIMHFSITQNPIEFCPYCGNQIIFKIIGVDENGHPK